MSIHYLLFLIYLGVIFWLIPSIPFIRQAGLTTLETRFLLVLKIFAGIFCAFYFQRLSTNVDYLEYNAEGQLQYQLLLSNPKLFFTDFNHDIHAYGLGGLFESKDSFWAYIRFSLLFKLIALMDLISGGNFYFNTIIFCSIVFFGHVAFYRIYSGIYPGNKLKILFVCFLLPSLLLYTSCVHKDGVTFVSIGILSFIFWRFLSVPRAPGFKMALLFAFSLIGVFLFRNYVLVALVPAMITALLTKVLPLKKRLIFILSYAIFTLLFFLPGYINSSLDMPAAVVKRKADFILLGEGNTNIPMNNLYPNIKSFASNAPQAINHFLFRPYLWEFPQPAVLLTAMELFFYQLIIIAFLFFRKNNASVSDPFNLFGYALFINMMFIIGYTIPNIGAIVRYRSIFWIFLICPLVCSTDWKRLLFFRRPGSAS